MMVSLGEIRGLRRELDDIVRKLPGQIAHDLARQGLIPSNDVKHIASQVLHVLGSRRLLRPTDDGMMGDAASRAREPEHFFMGDSSDFGESETQDDLEGTATTSRCSASSGQPSTVPPPCRWWGCSAQGANVEATGVRQTEELDDSQLGTDRPFPEALRDLASLGIYVRESNHRPQVGHRLAASKARLKLKRQADKDAAAEALRDNLAEELGASWGTDFNNDASEELRVRHAEGLDDFQDQDFDTRASAEVLRGGAGQFGAHEGKGFDRQAGAKALRGGHAEKPGAHEDKSFDTQAAAKALRADALGNYEDIGFDTYAPAEVFRDGHAEELGAHEGKGFHTNAAATALRDALAEELGAHEDKGFDAHAAAEALRDGHAEERNDYEDKDFDTHAAAAALRIGHAECCATFAGKGFDNDAAAEALRVCHAEELGNFEDKGLGLQHARCG